MPSSLLTPLLRPERIQLHLTSTHRLDALQETAQLLKTHPDVSNLQGFYAELLARDQLDTTSVGHGFAVPHARTPYVRQIVLAVGRCDAGLEFPGGEKIRMLFMLGTPKTRPGDYLQVLSTLCRLLKEPENRDAFLGAASAEDFIQVLGLAEQKLMRPV